MKLLIPRMIDIETSATCNLHCVGCPINSASKPGLMDFDFFKSIIDRIDFPTSLVPWLNGEPLLHPRYADMLAYIERRGLPYYPTTNGHFWRDDVFDIITAKNSSCYQIIFSLDGVPGSSSIAAARPGSDPNKAVSTIMRFLELKKSRNAHLDVAVKIVERGQDWGEIEEYILYWLRAGVDYVCSGRMLSQTTESPMRRHPCQYSDNAFMVIKFDGRLVLCSYNDQITNKNGYPIMVLDKTTPLLEAYNSEPYRRFREDQRNGIYPAACSSCGYAYTGYGLDGEVRFRQAPELLIYHRRDYYNSFWSLSKKGKPASFYLQGAADE